MAWSSIFCMMDFSFSHLYHESNMSADVFPRDGASCAILVLTYKYYVPSIVIISLPFKKIGELWCYLYYFVS